MKIKHRVFSFVQPIARWHRVIKVLAIIQALVTLVIPVILRDVDTGIWLLSLSLCGFWLSSYAILRLAHHHQPAQSGLKSWLVQMWENAIFVIWLLVAVTLFFLILKLVLFMTGQ